MTLEKLIEKRKECERILNDLYDYDFKPPIGYTLRYRLATQILEYIQTKPDHTTSIFGHIIYNKENNESYTDVWDILDRNDLQEEKQLYKIILIELTKELFRKTTIEDILQ